MKNMTSAKNLFFIKNDRLPGEAFCSFGIYAPGYFYGFPKQVFINIVWKSLKTKSKQKPLLKEIPPIKVS